MPQHACGPRYRYSGPYHLMPFPNYSPIAQFKTPHSSRCTVGQRLSPSPTYAETLFSRATSIRWVRRPCLTVSWTCGGRINETRTPSAASEAAASSEATRGIVEWGASSSVALRVSTLAERRMVKTTPRRVVHFPSRGPPPCLDRARRRALLR